MTSPALRGGMVATLPVAASWWLAGIALVTVIGFQPALSRPGRSLDMAHALHGVTALGWSLTLVGQSWLAARRRRDAHRLLAVAVAFVRHPAVHARALAATGLLALPAGLGRLYMRVWSVDPVVASWLALGTAALLVLLLIVADRRAGVRDVVQPLVLAAVLAVPLLAALMARAPWFSSWAGRLAAA